MTEEERFRFLHSLNKTVERNPDLAGDAINAITNGLDKAIYRERSYAMDMETLASAFYSALDERYKKSNKEWFDRLISRKILDNKDKLSYEWEEHESNK